MKRKTSKRVYASVPFGGAPVTTRITAAIYARKSTPQQAAKGHKSVDRQEELSREFATLHGPFARNSSSWMTTSPVPSSTDDGSWSVCGPC
jgi:hypothetical protein